MCWPGGACSNCLMLIQKLKNLDDVHSSLDLSRFFTTLPSGLSTSRSMTKGFVGQDRSRIDDRGRFRVDGYCVLRGCDVRHFIIETRTRKLNLFLELPRSEFSFCLESRQPSSTYRKRKCRRAKNLPVSNDIFFSVLYSTFPNPSFIAYWITVAGIIHGYHILAASSYNNLFFSLGTGFGTTGWFFHPS